jgi:hypothetical protein
VISDRVLFLTTRQSLEEEADEDEEGATEKITKPKPLIGDAKEFDEAFNESVRVLTKHFK